MVIDANVYWFDEAIFSDEVYAQRFFEDIPTEYGFGYRVKSLADGKRQIILEKPRGYANLNYIEGDYRLEKILADLDEAAIEQAVMKIPGCHEWMSLELCRKFNDGMAKFAKDSLGRLKGLAVVPPKGTAEVREEIDRCFHQLGFTGVQLMAHYGRLYLDDEAFAPFFEYLNEKKATVYIHHTPIPVEYQSLYDYDNVRRSYGRNVDQGTAVCRELFSGFFDKYPKLKFIHSMLGGGFFAIKNMILPKPDQSAKVTRFQTNTQNIAQNLQNNIFFEMSHAQPWGKEQLECAVKVLGADHILYGSSYPVRKEWLTEGPDFVRSLNISEEEQALILTENAKRLYHI